MAASDLQLAAGRSLASDLRDIRKKHGVDRKVVLDSTRLADDVIDQLEEDVLLNHPAFNKVYLRSLLCAYGDAIGLVREDVLSALEAVYDGPYNG
ncbi:MAG: helix-turn-helix domain-containing protein, partial [Rhodothermales bacterium]